ncbi:hypothetical protein HAX54_045482 [Datura stramonium]|uniref:Uncharacterized protein n=1 Tax=Datura stramonium TaxID=4076 RepID=A0ABS8WHN2_DATST|nr:hypothetical protein [Datura stramonium]
MGKIPCLSYVLVWGKEVDITPEVINSIYWAYPIHFGMGFARRMEDRYDQYAWVASIIVETYLFNIYWTSQIGIKWPVINAQSVKLANSIHPMIQYAIKTTMKPVVEKLGSFCAWVDVLEDEVAGLREEIESQKAMVFPMGIDLNILTLGSDSSSEDRSPPNDWCVGVRQVEMHEDE